MPMVKAGTFLSVPEDQRIVRVKMPNEHIIFAMTSEKRIQRYFIDKKIEKSMVLELKNIINFDIFEDKYFVVYTEPNIAEVYLIDQYIYL